MLRHICLLMFWSVSAKVRVSVSSPICKIYEEKTDNCKIFVGGWRPIRRQSRQLDFGEEGTNSTTQAAPPSTSTTTTVTPVERQSPNNVFRAETEPPNTDTLYRFLQESYEEYEPVPSHVVLQPLHHYTTNNFFHWYPHHGHYHPYVHKHQQGGGAHNRAPFFHLAPPKPQPPIPPMLTFSRRFDAPAVARRRFGRPPLTWRRRGAPDVASRRFLSALLPETTTKPTLGTRVVRYHKIQESYPADSNIMMTGVNMRSIETEPPRPQQRLDNNNINNNNNNMNKGFLTSVVDMILG